MNFTLENSISSYGIHTLYRRITTADSLPRTDVITEGTFKEGAGVVVPFLSLAGRPLLAAEGSKVPAGGGA